MKILFITGVFENDATGAARFAKLIHGSGGEQFTIMSEDTLGGERIIKIDAKPIFYQTKLWQYFRISHFRNELEKYEDEFDVFVFNNPILAYKFDTQKPCFVFVHDEKLIKVRRTFRFDYLRKHILRRIEKRVLESGVNIISNSQHITKRLIENYNVSPKKISLLYQGIDLSNKLRIYKKEMSREVIEILFVKNDYLIGGLPELIEALEILKDYQFKLSIVGTTRLQESDLNKAENCEIDVKGIMNNNEVIELMYNHDILCIPARFEPLGVAVMEGLAVGIPTITTGVGGLPEVTNNGTYIWECQPNNPQSLSEQIKACISSPELRTEKSRNGKKYVHDRFDFNEVVSRFTEILDKK